MADHNPFGGMNQDARDRLPPPKSVAQAASGVVGFGVMGLGGLIIAVAVLLYLAKSPVWVVVLPVGLGISYLGYWLFGKSRRSTRRSAR